MKLTYSEKSKRIKKNATDSHVLPYDLSMYDEVKYVLPNHYLNISKRKIKRFYPTGDIINYRDINGTISKSSIIISEALEAYLKKYNLAVGLTSGMDSRLILSFLKEDIDKVKFFTFKRFDINNETDDIKIPKKIAEKYKLDYLTLIESSTMNSNMDLFKEKLGYMVNSLELRNASIYSNSDIRDYYSIDGNILLLAKSSFGNRLPKFLCTISYLTTKTHSYSKDNRTQK